MNFLAQNANVVFISGSGLGKSQPMTGSTPSIDAVRTTEQSKGGIGVKLAQTFTPHFGGFRRAMWAEGKAETDAFTKADGSLSFGGLAKGRLWGLPADTLGVTFASQHAVDATAPHVGWRWAKATLNKSLAARSALFWAVCGVANAAP